MLTLVELAGVRVVIDGELSPSQDARARQAWQLVAPFVKPVLLEILREAVEVDVGAFPEGAARH